MTSSACAVVTAPIDDSSHSAQHAGHVDRSRGASCCGRIMSGSVRIPDSGRGLMDRGAVARSANVLEDAVELVQRVIGDDELALAGRGVLDLHARAELLAQVAFELADVRIRARRRALARGRLGP